MGPDIIAVFAHSDLPFLHPDRLQEDRVILRRLLQIAEPDLDRGLEVLRGRNAAGLVRNRRRLFELHRCGPELVAHEVGARALDDVRRPHYPVVRGVLRVLQCTNQKIEKMGNASLGERMEESAW